MGTTEVQGLDFASENKSFRIWRTFVPCRRFSQRDLQGEHDAGALRAI